jgi:hypothetical protein
LSGQPATLVPIEDVAALGSALQTVLSERCATPRALRQPVAYDQQRYERLEAVQRVLGFYDEVQSSVVAAMDQGPFMRRSPTHA